VLYVLQPSSCQAVEGHVESLRAWTYQQLSGLRHSNGVPLLKMFGAHEEGPKHQGGIFQFQVNYSLIYLFDNEIEFALVSPKGAKHGSKVLASTCVKQGSAGGVNTC
jgi:hypothetical protein